MRHRSFLASFIATKKTLHHLATGCRAQPNICPREHNRAQVQHHPYCVQYIYSTCFFWDGVSIFFETNQSTAPVYRCASTDPSLSHVETGSFKCDFTSPGHEQLGPPAPPIFLGSKGNSSSWGYLMCAGCRLCSAAALRN